MAAKDKFYCSVLQSVYQCKIFTGTICKLNGKNGEKRKIWIFKTLRVELCANYSIYMFRMVQSIHIES